MTDFADYVWALMKHMGVNQSALAVRLGIAQPTISRWFKHDAEPSQGNLRRVQELARQVGFETDGIDNMPLVAAPYKSGITYVEIRCFVGAGAEIFRIEGSSEVLEDIELPLASSEPLEAVLVRGESMYPVYRDRDVLVLSEMHDGVHGMLNRECAVELADGRRFVKILRAGSQQGLYNLQSYNGSLIENVEVRLALPIKFVKRSETTL